MVDAVVKGATREAAPAEKAMVGEVIDLHELWACTNCMYCMEHCSSSIEHVPKIVGMRQYKVLTEADFAPELQLTYRNMENNSNPWGIGSHLRADWAKDLGIKTLAEDPNVEYLFYVGCSGSFDDRGKKVSVAFAKILKAAGVSFGILGTEEGCCGDSAMRGGNEYLYQTLAQANIEVMKGYDVKKIICHLSPRLQRPEEGLSPFRRRLRGLSPHGDHRRSDRQGENHPQETGGGALHLPRFLLPRPVQRDLRPAPADPQGRSRPETDGDGAEPAPRASAAAPAGRGCGWRRTSASGSTTCGPTRRSPRGPTRIAVGCPFCLTMLSDGIKDRKKEESMAALDIAEIVWKAMDLEEEKPPVDVCAAPPEDSRDLKTISGDIRVPVLSGGFSCGSVLL